MAKYMPRDKVFSVQNSPFSTWHRNHHDGISYADLDVLGLCPACAKILYIADTIYNRNDEFKGKSHWLRSPYFQVAEALNVPYFEFFYTVDETTPERDITAFTVKRLRPYKQELMFLTPDEMLQYLEYKTLIQHGPNCDNREYLLERVKANKSQNLFARKYQYVQILSC